MTRPVIAGTDFSPSGQAAVAYAAQFAARHNAPLHLIHAHVNPVATYTGIGMAFPHIAGEDAAVDWIDGQLKQIAEDLRQGSLRLAHVEARRVAASPASALIEASREAQVTVVGCRGIGGFEELLLGSVSAQVAAHAHGPVIVVRPPVPDNAGTPDDVAAAGPVLAGYDGSSASQAALEFAATEAHARSTRLVVAYAYLAEPRLDATDLDRMVAEAEQVAAQGIGYVRDRYPALETEPRVIPSVKPEQALTEASMHAALTVVGCRGRGGLTGMLLGSVSRAVVHHAYHPVAVVHPAEH